MTFAVVAYDTPSDRRRNEMRKRLKGFLFHVQKSVFEGELRERDLRRLVEVLRRTSDRHRDAVRVYQLCGACAARSRPVAGTRLTSLAPATVVGSSEPY